MDKKQLEILEFTGIGYKPVVDYGTWRVAVLNYIDELIPERIERLERHNETDEVFVLWTGQAVLFMGDPKSDGAGGDSEVSALHPHVMEPLKMYNVKRGAWHAVVLSRDASILLVENRDTSTSNSDYTPLNPGLRQILIETSAREIPADWS
jgi:ureidoglycolate hydrolase